MSNIFKIYINNNNEYSKLYLFIKNKYVVANPSSKVMLPSIEELNSGFANYSAFSKSSVFTQHFKEDFNDEDLNIMQTTNGVIIFVDDVINYDDTIETIKLKFLTYYNNKVNEDEKICFEELYLYGLKERKFDIQDLFNTLTNNNKNELTYSNIIKYVANIYEKETILNSLKEEKEEKEEKDDTEKELYTYDDLTKIKLTTIKEYIQIGQTILNNKINYIVNPYYYINNSGAQLSENISTNNSTLLFEYAIYNDALYVCLASDFFKQKKSIIDEETIIKLYYCFLYKNNILNNVIYYSEKINLIKETHAMLSNINFINKNKLVYTLNTINVLSDALKYDASGVNAINFNITHHPH